MINFKHNYEPTLLHSKLEIQEETIRTINQEIHDNIGQVLSLAKLQLNILPEDVVKGTTAETITSTKDLLGKAIVDLRSLTKRLQPNEVNEFSLEKSIRLELEALEKAKACSARLSVEGSPYTIPVQIQIILFRMVQEAIANIKKHAFASQVNVTMNFHPLCFSLLVRDNGLGFSYETNSGQMQGGRGLKNMKDRSEAIGAGFCIEETPGGGTTVKITLPN